MTHSQSRRLMRRRLTTCIALAKHRIIRQIYVTSGYLCGSPSALRDVSVRTSPHAVCTDRPTSVSLGTLELWHVLVFFNLQFCLSGCVNIILVAVRWPVGLIMLGFWFELLRVLRNGLSRTTFVAVFAACRIGSLGDLHLRQLILLRSGLPPLLA